MVEVPNLCSHHGVPLPCVKSLGIVGIARNHHHHPASSTQYQTYHTCLYNMLLVLCCDSFHQHPDTALSQTQQLERREKKRRKERRQGREPRERDQLRTPFAFQTLP
jgi:hypothetical protein